MPKINDEFADAKSQAQFCTELMLRLNEEVQGAEKYYGMMKNHTRMQSDIIRLRRELLELSKILDPWRTE